MRSIAKGSIEPCNERGYRRAIDCIGQRRLRFELLTRCFNFGLLVLPVSDRYQKIDSWIGQSDFSGLNILLRLKIESDDTHRILCVVPVSLFECRLMDILLTF